MRNYTLTDEYFLNRGYKKYDKHNSRDQIYICIIFKKDLMMKKARNILLTLTSIAMSG